MLKLKSPAKINLYLRILRRRQDGYHDIVTLFEKIDIFDEITFIPRKTGGIKIACDSKKVPLGEKNLAFKAAKALLDYAGKDKSVLIKIKKRIPVAGGLAGGSSNAAVTLFGLNRLWKLGLSRKELMKLGVKLGADVNFFLSGERFAVGKGRGEVTSPLNVKRALWHVLVNPGKGLSTKAIYEYWDNMYPKARFALTAALADVKIINQSIRSNDLTLLAKSLHNDLEQPAQAKDNIILRIKRSLESCGAECVLMSGSGSTVFCIMPSRKEAMRVRQELSRLRNGWQIFVVRTC
jgi:4-diphosphocytidyl-2-C-methyl-D-erythritol kinase